MGFWLELAAYLTSPLTWCFFVLGAVVGSFLNVVILRIPEGTFWKHTRSVCPACGKTIPFYLNIPILSWLLLRGRARCCGAPLTVQYVLVELGTALLFPVIYWKFPFIQEYRGALAWYQPNLLRAIHATILASVLLVCSVIDLRLMIIPDVISLPMILLTPLAVWLSPELDWLSALGGVALGFGLLYGIAWAYWLVRREVGMGMGDVKLLAAIGGWLGVQAILPTIFYGSIIGAICGLLAMLATRSMSLKTAIPFGPFLAIGALLHLFMGGRLHELLPMP